jgi:hypothetical protein
MQGKVLGMAVGIFDEAGKDSLETGRAGELVCTRPHPSIPVRFWGDDARGRAYHDLYPGVWCHGDIIIHERYEPAHKGDNPRLQVRILVLPSCVRPRSHAYIPVTKC